MVNPMTRGIDRRGLMGAGLIAGALSTAAAAKDAPDPAETIDLWPAGPPGASGVTVKEELTERRKAPADLRDRIVAHVTRPRLTVFRPRRSNGAAILMAPGGGYKWVVVDKEGFECARWFAARGYTCFVLYYRLPADRWGAGPDAPLQDAQRAMRVVRRRAKALGIDPNRVAAMGFSAGGHVAGSLVTRSEAKVYEPVDEADRLSARPDLGCLVYPVASMIDSLAHMGSRIELLGAKPTSAQIAKYSVEAGVTASTPPTFLLHTADDAAVPIGNSLAVFAALQAAKVGTEMHIFEEGGHGFGLRFAVGKPVEAWPELFTAWAKRRGL
jgi:acetyl esterase/lipase